MTMRRRSMPRFHILLAGIATVLLAVAMPTAAAGQGAPHAGLPQARRSVATSADGCDAVPGRVLVRFSARASRSDKAAARADVHGRSVRAFRLVPGLELLSTDLPVG